MQPWQEALLMTSLLSINSCLTSAGILLGLQVTFTIKDSLQSDLPSTINLLPGVISFHLPDSTNASRYCCSSICGNVAFCNEFEFLSQALNRFSNFSNYFFTFDLTVNVPFINVTYQETKRRLLLLCFETYIFRILR